MKPQDRKFNGIINIYYQNINMQEPKPIIISNNVARYKGWIKTYINIIYTSSPVGDILRYSLTSLLFSMAFMSLTSTFL